MPRGTSRCIESTPSADYCFADKHLSEANARKEGRAMLLIPAIDLKDGKCVRLRQGRMDDETVFSDDPVAMAARWVAAGARRLHIVDLNGAFAGQPKNAPVVHAIAEAFPDVPIQVGGGIRDEETIEAYLAAGVRYVIIGTKAVTAPHFVSDVCTEFPGHVIVGLDAKDGRVAVDGWSKLSTHDVIDLARHFEQDGVEAIVYTDISRDGMLSGVNVEATLRLARAIHIPVIASGGIRTLDDVRALCQVAEEGITGAITGRAIYEGTLDFAEGQTLADALAGQTSGREAPTTPSPR
jgi:phosphoribosylformimino-5-aminoimidazole carboxamide ribotide isomerase